MTTVMFRTGSALVLKKPGFAFRKAVFVRLVSLRVFFSLAFFVHDGLLRATYVLFVVYFETFAF